MVYSGVERLAFGSSDVEDGMEWGHTLLCRVLLRQRNRLLDNTYYLSPCIPELSRVRVADLALPCLCFIYHLYRLCTRSALIARFVSGFTKGF